MIKTPYYICYEELLQKNLQTLEYIQKQSDCKILLALKGFALWSSFELVSKYLKGCSASGLFEAKLAREEFCKYDKTAQVHTYSPAFCDGDIEEIAKVSDHIVFNTPSQLFRYAQITKDINKDISLSLRINPQVSSSPKEIYNPCGLYSRLGTTAQYFDERVLKYIDGLHFHALCEEDASALESVLNGVEDKFGKYLKNIKFINFGGGHHITKKGYDIEKLIWLIKEFGKKYDVEIYLEPGEAVGWQSGDLVCSVLDTFKNGMDIAIVDISAEAHMPDTLAMPYRADIQNAGLSGEKKYTYRIGGNTCLAGDIMGDYSFDERLKIGDKIVFKDQIHYTFVKSTTFNGVRLPSIVYEKKDGKRVVKEFGYEDYKNRLS